MRDAANLAMARKYGMIDRVEMLFRDRDDSVPILLNNEPPRRDRVLGVNR
jgi:hypothetical protein